MVKINAPNRVEPSRYSPNRNKSEMHAAQISTVDVCVLLYISIVKRSELNGIPFLNTKKQLREPFREACVLPY